MDNLALRLPADAAAQLGGAQTDFAAGDALPGDFLQGHWRDYVDLLKPRVMILVVFTGIAGMVAAPGSLHPVLALTAIIALTFGAGAAGAINMWFDRDIDALMTRTKTRPVPAGKVSPDAALAFALFVAAASVFVMAFVNWTAAGVLAFAIWFYAHFYTMILKRRTAQNIVIGGAAGAFPPVVGWAAVTGDVTLFPLLMFAIVFLWTPPHFWALALVAKIDYAKAGIPMLPVTAGKAVTRWNILAYTVALTAVAIAPWPLGYTGPVYGVAAIVLSGLYLLSAVNIMITKSNAASWRSFGYSIFYLFALFTALMLDQLGVGL